MHGAGNDFVVVDCRPPAALRIDAPLARNLADRHAGVGCDQIMLVDPARTPGAIAGYRILNADGSEARQCGNGVRCVVAWLARNHDLESGDYLLDGPNGPVRATIDAQGLITIELEAPDFRPERVPDLGGSEQDPQRLTIAGDTIEMGVVAVGNLHAVLLVGEAESAPVARLGPAIEHHPSFPDRVNVGFAEIMDRQRIRLRVHERGVGETLACGSGACAAVAVLHRRGLLGDSVAVVLPGGTLHVEWRGEGPIRLSGPTTFVFEGTLLT
jgi:diaminopimelate epimerase